jgi:tRNA-dihydrouridine synthase C
MQAPSPQIILAPMEGVIDAAMRSRLTSLGGYSRCVTEFVRVTDVLLPERVFFRLCPELQGSGCTPNGTPVYVQLLGSDAKALALNAQRAVQLGAKGVDLNFGCPAKTVNNSMGGSVLLKEPCRVIEIVSAVREAVDSVVPVTAKIRLGYENTDALPQIVQGIHEVGATELAIHARTKFDGYKPPAYWDRVQEVMRSEYADKTIINGEIWTVTDSRDALARSACKHIMLGRGALSAPDLAKRIHDNDASAKPMSWSLLVNEVLAQFISSDQSSPRHVGNRTKQWLAYLKRTYPQANQLFQRLRTLHDATAIEAAFAAHIQEDLK